MEPIVSHENWRNCFCEVAPGLLLFARQWVQSAADAEDIVQDAFVKFWRRNHDIANRALLYAAVRSLALDFIRRDARRARREATVLAEVEPAIEPHFQLEDDTQSALAAAVGVFAARSAGGTGLENLERSYIQRNRRRAGNFAEHSSIAIPVCVDQSEENFATAMNDFSELEKDLRTLRPTSRRHAFRAGRGSSQKL